MQINEDYIKEQAFLSVLKTKLSEKRSRIAMLYIHGLTAQKIAENIGITRNTVCVHIQSIYKTLGVRSKWQLIEMFEKF